MLGHVWETTVSTGLVYLKIHNSCVLFRTNHSPVIWKYTTAVYLERRTTSRQNSEVVSGCIEPGYQTWVLRTPWYADAYHRVPCIQTWWCYKQLQDSDYRPGEQCAGFGLRLMCGYNHLVLEKNLATVLPPPNKQMGSTYWHPSRVVHSASGLFFSFLLKSLFHSDAQL